MFTLKQLQMIWQDGELTSVLRRSSFTEHYWR